MYAVIRHYHHDPKYSNEINEKIITDFLPLIKKIDGFLSHYRIDNGQGEIATFSVFKDKLGAEASTKFAVEWAQKSFSAPIFLEHPETMEGDVVIHD
ncbi:MAG: hypothetical protein WCP41_09580 [Verrucomicrobiota bacterium]|jgi:hypothetical protein